MPIPESTEVNLKRVESLITIFEYLWRERPGTRYDTPPEILRAIVVLLHATLEDYLREVSRITILGADRDTLSKVPLKGISLTGRPEKFHLGDLLAFKDKYVAELIQESIDDYLDKVSFNNTTDIAVALSKAGINPESVNEYFPQLERLTKRRHHIVHQGDKSLKRGPGRSRVQGIRKEEVLRWVKIVRKFIGLVQSEMDKKADPP